MFKGILEYMGDRKPLFFVKDVIEIACACIKLVVDNPQLRDEIFVQLIKQTTLNPSEKSEEKGWELFCMVLEAYILPTQNFETFVKQHFQTAIERSQDPRIRQCAVYCMDRINFLISKPRSPILPTISIVIRGKEAPFIKSVFRSSLDQIMEYQKQSHPHLEIPLIQKTLIDQIIQFGGLTSVGIFRIAPQMDEISQLRIKLEDSHGAPISDQDIDPYVSACLLKVWLAEILKPVVPAEYYYAVTSAFKDWPSLEKVINSFPPVHKNTLYYLFNFLQRVVKEDNKMSIQNVAIVISPTLCRCPTTDAKTLMQQTIIESEVCVNLLKNMPCVYNIFGK